jgi:GntP family permease
MMVRPDQALLVGIGILAVLMPAILMLANTLGETLLPKSSLGARVTAFLGDPMIAMLVYREAVARKSCARLLAPVSTDRRHFADHRGRRRVSADSSEIQGWRRHRASHAAATTIARLANCDGGVKARSILGGLHHQYVKI